jgi:RNA polymerase-binding transcription factor DksA
MRRTSFEHYGKRSRLAVIRSVHSEITTEGRAAMFDWNKQLAQRVRKRLRQELDELYLDAEGNATAQDPHGPDYNSDLDGLPTSQRIAQILRAFHSIEAGEYGHCANCGKPIESARLENDVAVNTCEACNVIAYR